MTNEELLNKKQIGDAKLIGDILNISSDHALKLLGRTKAKRHNAAIEALRTIVESREKAVEQAKSLQSK